MSKGGASAPPAVNFGSLATDQGNANQAAAAAQAQLNNVNTTSPLGGSYFSQIPGTQGPNGTAQWQLQQSLTPGGQNVLNQQQGLAGQAAANADVLEGIVGGQSLAGNALTNWAGNLTGQLPGGPLSFNNGPGLPTGIGATGVPLPTSIANTGVPLPTSINYNGLPALPSSSTDFSSEVTGAQNAAYNTQEAYLRPQQAEQTSDFNQQMADQGINQGTAAYDRAYGDLSRGQTFANQQAQNAAVAAGNQEQQALFGENLGARQQGAGEAQAQFGAGLSANQQAQQQAQAQFAAGLSANQQAQQAAAQQFQAQLQARQQGTNEALQTYQSLPNLIGSIAGTGSGLLSGASGDTATLGSLGNFSWAGGVPTFGGSPTTVQPANVVGAQQAANQGNFNRFAAGSQLNNQIGSGIGSLASGIGGSNLLFGSGGLPGALGASPSQGLLGGWLSNLFGGGSGSGFGGAGSLAFLQ